MSLKNPVTPPGIDSGTARLVVQRLNYYVTPGPPLNSTPGHHSDIKFHKNPSSGSRVVSNGQTDVKLIIAVSA
jgi:hypothetical protein